MGAGARTMHRWLRSLALAGALLGAAQAGAVQPDEILADPALEARARELSRELRCMVCQNQSIDDSDAPLARDLRVLVRERLVAGDSNKAVIDFLTARYGDFVLLKPRFAWDTAVLWFTPAVVLLLGVCGLVVLLRRRQGAAMAADSSEPQLTSAERARLAELLGQSRKSTGQSR
jgi:cytochrome c-type biogenesis protein CcmH